MIGLETPEMINIYLQGVQGQTFMFQFALTGRNMQAKFCLSVVLKSRNVEILGTLQSYTSQVL